MDDLDKVGNNCHESCGQQKVVLALGYVIFNLFFRNKMIILYYNRLIKEKMNILTKLSFFFVITKGNDDTEDDQRDQIPITKTRVYVTNVVDI